MGGGSRSGVHRKDQVVWGHLAEPVALVETAQAEEENPFLVKPTQRAPKAPGRSTTHEPRNHLEDEDTTGVGSLVYRPPSPFDAQTGMLTPPPTRPERGVRTVPKQPRVDPAEATRKREAKEQMKRMMDIEHNPFLVKPGESSSRPRQRAAPFADESKPTVTYVFRGAKKVFANPFYPTDAPFPQALLDPEDEDFEPHPNPKPRLLWPSPPPRSKRINLDEEGDNEEDMASPPSSPIATPRRRLFGKDTVRVAADQEKTEDEEENEDEDEDVDMPQTPTRRRLFPVPPSKRPAEHAPDAGYSRDDKRVKGMRV